MVRKSTRIERPFPWAACEVQVKRVGNGHARVRCERAHTPCLVEVVMNPTIDGAVGVDTSRTVKERATQAMVYA